MNITGYDVVYNERVYHCIDLSVEWETDYIYNGAAGVYRSKFLFVSCFDSDCGFVALHDEAQRFRFVRRDEQCLNT